MTDEDTICSKVYKKYAKVGILLLQNMINAIIIKLNKIYDSITTNENYFEWEMVHNMLTHKKFDIWMADLSFVVGSEQGGVKPVCILSNNIGNKFSPVVTVAVLTSRIKRVLPTHVYLNAELNGLDRDSILLVEQVRTVDKNRLFKQLSRVHSSLETEINRAIKISLDTENDIKYLEYNNTTPSPCFV